MALRGAAPVAGGELPARRSVPGPHEVGGTYLAARETAERAELGSASRGEVQQAIEDLRSVLDGFLRQAGLEPR